MRGNLAVIAAMGTNRVIGVGGGLPWRLPEDQKRFKALTMGHAIIMGRKTYDSIGRALPGRRSIVVSRQVGLALPGCEVVSSFEAALALVEGHDTLPFVIGGEALYAAALEVATRLFLTLVPAAPQGDAYFPELDLTQWREADRVVGEGGLAYVQLVRVAAHERLSAPSPAPAAPSR